MNALRPESRQQRRQSPPTRPRKRRARPGPAGRAARAGSSPTNDVVGRGLISRTWHDAVPSSQMKSTPTNPRRPAIDSTAGRSCSHVAAGRVPERAPSILEPAVADRHPLLPTPISQARRSPVHQEARTHRLARYERLEQGDRHPRASSGKSPGVRQIKRIDRAGAVDRLEDGRIVRIGGKPVAGTIVRVGGVSIPSASKPLGQGVPCRRSARPPRPTSPSSRAPAAANRG